MDSTIQPDSNAADPPLAAEERRREPRFAVEVPASIRKINEEDEIPATTVDLSASGALFQLTSPLGFSIGDDVMFEISMPDSTSHEFANWGVAKVVRLADGKAAVELYGGVYDSAGNPCAGPTPDPNLADSAPGF